MAIINGEGEGILPESQILVDYPDGTDFFTTLKLYSAKNLPFEKQWKGEKSYVVNKGNQTTTATIFPAFATIPGTTFVLLSYYFGTKNTTLYYFLPVTPIFLRGLRKHNE